MFNEMVKQLFLSGPATRLREVEGAASISIEKFEFSFKVSKVIYFSGIPERFQPYRCKYDWTEFEKRELLRKAQEAANKPDEE